MASSCPQNLSPTLSWVPMASLSVFLKIEETEMVANEEATAIEQDAEMVALVANQAEDNHEMDMKV